MLFLKGATVPRGAENATGGPVTSALPCSDARTVRAAFVMEQALGHVTAARNLLDALESNSARVQPTWLPIPFEVTGVGRQLPLYRSNWSVRASWRARRALDRARATQPLDALFFHTQVTALFCTDLMRSIPSIVSLDATPINYDSLGAHYGHRPAGNGWLDRQKYLCNRRAFHAARRLVTWSDWARRSLVDDYGVDGDCIHVIPPGAAPAYFDLGARRAATADASGEDDRTERPLRLLFVGGDFERKGGPLLLECLRGPMGERCQLDVVTRSEVPPQRNVRVHHGVSANSPELLRLFAAADVFVFPTLADCLAIVLMEAAAAGLPVITTNVGGLSEALVPDESGTFIAPNDGRALALALDRLAGDRALCRRMGRAGYEHARRKFDARQNSARLLELVIEVAHREPGDSWRASNQTPSN